MTTCSEVLRTSRVKYVCIYSVEPGWCVEYGVSDDVIDLPRFLIAGILAIKSVIALTIGYT